MQKVKPALLRGFDQEYLPQEQLQFNRLSTSSGRNFELYGFLPIETPSAERREVLTSKGGVEKEIYALTRLAEADDDEAATKGALRFDLTVPLARYVAMRERELAFPFRRYQIQRVWRGETPQANKGRFREFYQCDIDIIGRDKLSYLAEAEIPSVIYSVFREMAIGEFRIRINNRKVLQGMLQSSASRRKGGGGAAHAGQDRKGRRGEARAAISSARASLPPAGLYELIYDPAERPTKRWNCSGPLERRNRQGRARRAAQHSRRDPAVRRAGHPRSPSTSSVVRGLDYYTGTIYETQLVAHPEIGSICSGGRYDDLASYFTDTRLPGVGISIGLTRLFSQPERGRAAAAAARAPRRRPCDDHGRRNTWTVPVDGDAPARGGHQHRGLPGAGEARNQLAYADRKGFRVAVIAGENEFAKETVQIKNLASEEAARAAIAELVQAVKAALKTHHRDDPCRSISKSRSR